MSHHEVPSGLGSDLSLGSPVCLAMPCPRPGSRPINLRCGYFVDKTTCCSQKSHCQSTIYAFTTFLIMHPTPQVVLSDSREALPDFLCHLDLGAVAVAPKDRALSMARCAKMRRGSNPLSLPVLDLLPVARHDASVRQYYHNWDT